MEWIYKTKNAVLAQFNKLDDDLLTISVAAIGIALLVIAFSPENKMMKAAALAYIILP